MYIWIGISPLIISIFIWLIIKIGILATFSRTYECENVWVKWKWKLNFKSWVQEAIPHDKYYQFIRNWVVSIFIELIMILFLYLILALIQYEILKLLAFLKIDSINYYTFADVLIRASWVQLVSVFGFWTFHLFNLWWTISRASIKRNYFNR